MASWRVLGLAAALPLGACTCSNEGEKPNPAASASAATATASEPELLPKMKILKEVDLSDPQAFLQGQWVGVRAYDDRNPKKSAPLLSAFVAASTLTFEGNRKTTVMKPKLDGGVEQTYESTLRVVGTGPNAIHLMETQGTADRHTSIRVLHDNFIAMRSERDRLTSIFRRKGATGSYDPPGSGASPSDGGGAQTDAGAE